MDVMRHPGGGSRLPAVGILVGGHLLAAVLSAATYHVDPSGDDSGSGSSSDPWQTLQKAADTVVAGDTVLVHAGTYAGFDLRTSGTDGSPINFSADDGVVIDQANTLTGDGINIENADHVVIEGFTVQGNGTCPGTIRNGFRAAQGSRITFRNNRGFDNCERAFFTAFVDDLLIEDNEGAGSVDEHGIYTSNSGDRPVIRNNFVHGNDDAGIHMNGDASAGGDGIISDAVVEGNVIRDNGLGGAAGINCDGVQDSTIRNNLIVGNHATGIALFQQDGADGSKRNLVAGNTVVNDSDGRWGITIANGSTDNTVLGNVFLSRHSFRGAMDIRTDSHPGLVSDFNAVEDVITTDGGDSTLTLSEWQAQTGQDANSFVATEAELFVDPTLPGGDYHLKEGSPAIDAGTGTGASPVDFEGDRRPQGTEVDIGADELVYCLSSEVLELTDDTVTTDTTREACRIVAGPNYAVEGPAVLTLQVRELAILEDGFEISTGAGLVVENDPEAGL